VNNGPSAILDQGDASTDSLENRFFGSMELPSEDGSEKQCIMNELRVCEGGNVGLLCRDHPFFWFLVLLDNVKE